MDSSFEHTDSGRSIAALLKRLIGLNEKSMGSAGVQRAIAQAMHAAEYDTVDDYWQHLQASQTAVSALIEAIVVIETSFFRNPESFAFLKRWAAQTGWLKASKTPLRLLSLPCSTGEEPYSIAMTLFEAGLSAEQFQIDAVDVSEVALSQARHGIFSAYSFRQGQSVANDAEALIDCYFQKTGERYYLSDRVRSQVRFLQGNLADPRCLYETRPYDVVFCRNLLIYFHQVARDRALRTLHRLLKPDGLLFVGYAETNQTHPHQFVSIRCPQAFVYRRAGTVVEPPTLPAEMTAPAATSLPTRALPLRPRSEAKSLAMDSTKPTALTTPIDTVLPPVPVSPSISCDRPPPPAAAAVTALDNIRLLADRGELAIAAAQCDRYLHSHPTNAAAYLLLGEIYQAQEIDDAAAHAFRKAIYLDPTCVEALLYLALLYEHQDHVAAAQRLRQRIQRLTQET